MRIEKITIGHGSGAGLTRELINSVFASKFKITSLDDSAKIGKNMVISTDAHVISPLFFPGGDIGKLAITGTINDVAMSGAIPKFIVAAFIIEAGFCFSDLKKIVYSMQKEAEAARVKIVGGDTKVVEKGKADGIFITTTGIGQFVEKNKLSAKKVRNGDKILVNGNLGDHTIALINLRQKLELAPAPRSDCAALDKLVQLILKNGDVNFLRDATRGGLATILNEIAEETKLGIILDSKKIPVSSIVTSISELLGLDPLYMANEGKLVAFVKDDTKMLISKMKKHELGRNTIEIGEVTDELQGVYLRTEIGGLRPLPILDSDPLPRIC